MSNRRKFLIQTFIGGMATGLGCRYGLASTMMKPAVLPPDKGTLPVILSTWNHGLAANKAAMEMLIRGGSVLDAVEQGVRISEADPEVTSVGYGGFPDAAGEVTLDACIMGPDGRAGSVACLKEIMHPISVARKVMEKTPHVMLVGDGAQQFALDQGFNENQFAYRSNESQLRNLEVFWCKLCASCQLGKSRYYRADCYGR